MAYLTIPDLVESETLLNFSPAPDGRTFSVVIDAGETAMRLMRAQNTGEHFELVVLMTDAQTIALDSVYVAEASVGGDPPVASISLSASDVRFL